MSHNRPKNNVSDYLPFFFLQLLLRNQTVIIPTKQLKNIVIYRLSVMRF